jgi:O-antigen/teichoic acid export membrane protein
MIFVFAAKFFGAISSVLFAFLVVELMDVNNSAELFLHFSIINILFVAIRFGSEAGLLKFLPPLFVSQRDEEISWYAFVVFKRISIGALLAGVVIWAANFFLDKNISLYATIIISFTYAAYYVLGALWHLKGRNLIAVFIMNCIFPSVMIFSVLLGFWLDALYVEHILKTSAILNFFSLVVILIYTVCSLNLKKTNVVPLENDTNEFNLISINSFKGTLAQQTIQWGTPVIAGIYLTAEASSDFFLIQRVAFSIGFILVVTNFIMMPRFSIILSDSGICPALEHAQKYNFYSAIAGILVVIIFSGIGFIGKNYFGYLETGTLLCFIIMLFGQATNICTGSIANILNNTGGSDVVKNVVISAASLNILLTYIFVQSLGPFALAMSISCSLLFLNVSQVYMFFRRSGYLYTPFFIRSR